ncbi:MAG TPA: hypothetical protein ENJ54_06835 [Chloroflexi bacterium]|nr:hypothetical protein [Chloroflexota bacterium]
MAKTTFGEEIYLRALTGKIVGAQMIADYAKVAFVSPRNIICSAISAAAEAAYILETGAQAAHFIVEPGQEAQAAQAVAAFQPEAVVLMFGGETPIEETKTLFVNFLKGLAEADLFTDLIVHVRIFAAGGLQAALQDDTIRPYLLDNEVYVYTANLDKGLFIYNIALIDEDGTISLDELLAFPVTVEHAELLNRSLRDKTLAWADA